MWSSRVCSVIYEEEKCLRKGWPVAEPMFLQEGLTSSQEVTAEGKSLSPINGSCSPKGERPCQGKQEPSVGCCVAFGSAMVYVNTISIGQCNKVNLISAARFPGLSGAPLNKNRGSLQTVSRNVPSSRSLLAALSLLVV